MTTKRILTSRRTALGALGTLLVTPSCTVHSVNHERPNPIDLPDAFEGGNGQAFGERSGKWWEDFEDPTLNALINKALEDNLELHVAWARMKQVEALYIQAGSGLWPSIDPNIGVNRSKNVSSIGGTTVSNEQTTFSASVPVSYELDVWGKHRSAQAAAEQDVLATRDDLEAAAMTLTANIAEQWFTVVEQRALTQLLEDQQGTNETYAELVELRFAQGQSIAADVYQQKQLVQGLDSQLTLSQAAEQVAIKQLRILTGGEAEIAAIKNLPALPPIPAAGLPSEMLQNRPDIRAARRRILAADYRVGVAIADRYPSFRLSGSIGLLSGDLGDIFEDFVYSLGGSAAVNIFDGGRRAAEVDRTEWVLEERIAQYGLALQNAVVEVESALLQEEEQRVAKSQLEEQVTLAESTLEVARQRYAQGLSDYLVVLTALRSLHQAQQSLLNADRRLLTNRIQLCRALGGGWTIELEAPKRRFIDEDEDEDDEDA